MCVDYNTPREMMPFWPYTDKYVYAIVFYFHDSPIFQLDEGQYDVKYRRCETATHFCRTVSRQPRYPVEATCTKRLPVFAKALCDYAQYSPGE